MSSRTEIFYLDLYHHIIYNTYCVYYINHDPFFLVGLPDYGDELALYQLEALISYGISIYKLYPDGELDFRYRDSLLFQNSVEYGIHKSKVLNERKKKVKSKKVNEYTFHGANAKRFRKVYRGNRVYTRELTIEEKFHRGVFDRGLLY